VADPTHGRTNHNPEEPVNEARAHMYRRLMDAQEQIAIDVVQRGGQYLSARALKKVVKQHVSSSPTDASGYDRLSDREREILKLLADGLALKEIASRLALSVKTVDTHKTNMMRKLDLHDRSEVIKYAIQRKLIRLPQHNGSSG